LATLADSNSSDLQIKNGGYSFVLVFCLMKAIESKIARIVSFNCIATLHKLSPRRNAKKEKEKTNRKSCSNKFFCHEKIEVVWSVASCQRCRITPLGIAAAVADFVDKTSLDSVHVWQRTRGSLL
jgi:hypothetical protein